MTKTLSPAAAFAAVLFVTRLLVCPPLPQTAPHRLTGESQRVHVSAPESAELDCDPWPELDALERFVECEENDDDSDRLRPRSIAGQILRGSRSALDQDPTCTAGGEELLARAPKTSPPRHS